MSFCAEKTEYTEDSEDSVVICWFNSSVKLMKIQMMDNKPTSQLPTNLTVLQQVARTYLLVYRPI